MAHVDFLISNDRHHAAMLRPVVAALAGRPGNCLRVLSLCEFRGLRSPVEQFRLDGVEFEKVVPFQFRRAPGGRAAAEPGSRRTRRLARTAGWWLLLERPVRRRLARRPDVVVLPNDAAFPYDYITRRLRARGIPFLLVQEGIRFPLPGEGGERQYGSAGATAVAAWGQASADYFRNVGVAEERICLTGNPRFDGLTRTDWGEAAERLRGELRLGEKNLLYLSNPIDDQGFCSRREKLALAGRFLRAMEPLFADPGLHLVIKLHGREAAADFRPLLEGLPYAGRVTIVNDAPLYPLLALAQAAIILASTVGLEALLFGLPLGVVEIPGAGFVHDYVSSGAARGLGWGDDMADGVKALLARGRGRGGAADPYVARNLATLEDATGRIAALVERVAGGNRDWRS